MDVSSGQGAADKSEQAIATVARYPGVRPFGDDDAHRHLFKGRDAEQYELLQMVLAERLVLLLARSGVGKSSLINAGLLQPLRAKQFFPLVVRISGAGSSPLDNLYDSVSVALNGSDTGVAIECEPADPARWNRTSLWHFFKTIQLWRDDQLLTPVLIIDQFEELFTLFTRQQRSQLIEELAGVIRGLRPAGHHNVGNGKRISDTAPEVKVVLAMREDYYANLEELRQRIPAVYTTALRLNPLNRRQASAAIFEPAVQDGEHYATAPFIWSPEALSQVLKFLCRQQLGEGKTAQGDQVEPFQLQLICQHVETLVRERQLDCINGSDIGGEVALQQILSNFYERTLDKIVNTFSAETDLRSKLEHLCEYGFITARGRRLLREESTIKDEDGIAPDILHEMVELRLLRKEPRVGDNYYELTHDTLIEPIQLSREQREQREIRRRKGRMLRLGIAALALLCLATAAVIVMQLNARDELQLAQQAVDVAEQQRVVAEKEVQTTQSQARLDQLAEQARREQQQLRLAQDIGVGEDATRQRKQVEQNLAATLKQIEQEEKRVEKVEAERWAANRKLVQLEEQKPLLAVPGEQHSNVHDAMVAVRNDERLDTDVAAAEVLGEPGIAQAALALKGGDNGARAMAAEALAEAADFDALSLCEQFDVLRDQGGVKAARYGLTVAQQVARLSQLDGLLERSAMVVTQGSMITSKKPNSIADPEAEISFKPGEKVWLYIWFSSPGEQMIEVEYLDGDGNVVRWDNNTKNRKAYRIGYNRLQGERLGYRLYTARRAVASGADKHQFRVYSRAGKLLCRRAFSVIDAGAGE